MNYNDLFIATDENIYNYQVKIFDKKIEIMQMFKIPLIFDIKNIYVRNNKIFVFQ